MRKLKLLASIFVLSALPASGQVAEVRNPPSSETILVSSQSIDTPATFRTRILSGESFITIRPGSQFAQLAPSDRPILIFSGMTTPMSVPIQPDGVFVWELATEESSPALSSRMRSTDLDREILVEGKELVIRRTQSGGPIEIVAIVR